jgi:hypothetical protein
MLVRLQPPELRQDARELVLVEQPGVLATLSRWRTRVRIPPGTLAGTVRKSAKRPSSNLGDRLWVRFPPVLLKKWPVGLAASGRQPLELEGWVRFPYGLLDQVVELADTRRSERRALTGVGVRLSPWSLRSGLEFGFQHGLISRLTPVRIRPPQLTAEYANRQSGQVESLVRVCGFESHLGYCNGPVVQRQRLLAHIQATMVRVHPGSLVGLLVQEEGAGSARRK